VNTMHSSDPAAFHARLKGTFAGMLQWQQLDALWVRVKSGTWYFYQIGEALPTTAFDAVKDSLRLRYCPVLWPQSPT